MRVEVRIGLTIGRRGRASRYGPGPSQLGELHLPRGTGRLPVVVLLHGGSWEDRHGKLVTRPLALDLVRRGHAVWNVEYRRLGPRGGGGWPATFEDVAAGLDHLAVLARGPYGSRLDLSDVTLVGHSAGGQLALWAGRRPVLPAGSPGADPAVVPTRLVALAPVTDLGRAQPHATQLLGGTAEEHPQRWAEADPLRAGAPTVPTLVVHPRDDARVPVERSRDYAQRWDVELVEPPGGHLDPIDPTSRAWAVARAWLERRRVT